LEEDRRWSEKKEEGKIWREWVDILRRE